MVLFILFVVCVVVQYCYGIFFRKYIGQISTTHVLSIANKQPVSVLICSKNEAENLRTNLPSILTQVYNDLNGHPLYEVIVIDDGSTDNTTEIISTLSEQYAHLRYLKIAKNEAAGKKAAIKAGVELSVNELLLLTDADCIPASLRWLELMTAPLKTGQEIVAGYSGYFAREGLLNAFIRWETVHTFLQYSTYAVAGIPYMAVGRNIACTKTAMRNAIDNPLWHKLPSGDDDMLVRICATSKNMAVVSDKDAFTMSVAKANLKEWIHQKQRHLSTGKYYKLSSQIRLAGYAVSHAGMWLLFFAAILGPWWGYVVMLMTVRVVLYLNVWLASLNITKERMPTYFCLPFDLGWMIYNFAFLPYITWKNKRNWK